MKKLACLLCVCSAFAIAAHAQVPSGSTGICKDGTYTSAASRDGACLGHHGIQTWYPLAAGTGSTPQASTQAAKKSGPAATAAGKPQAPGAAPNLVWVNTASNVYHCPGSDFYGKTKAGSYMTEAAAKAAGAHGARGQPCGL